MPTRNRTGTCEISITALTATQLDLIVGPVGLEPTCVQLSFLPYIRRREYKPMNNCAYCNTPTTNPKYCDAKCYAAGRHQNSSEGSKRVCIHCSRSYVYYRHKGHGTKECNSCRANRRRFKLKERSRPLPFLGALRVPR